MITENDIKKVIDDQWEIHREHFEDSVKVGLTAPNVIAAFKKSQEEDASLDAFLNELQPKGWNDDVLVCIYELLSK